MRPECEQFTGRSREICEGTADLPLHKINTQRARWGLEPLGEPGERPTKPTRTRAARPVQKGHADQPRDLAFERRVAYVQCPHRGPVLATVSGNVCGVGCGSTMSDVFECQHFREPAIKRARERYFEKIRSVVPTFGRLVCESCEIPRREIGKPVSKPAASPSDLSRLLTICITHYHRPDALARCIASLDKHFPAVPRVIQETEGNLSRGRNTAIAQVTTPYLMIGEEDFEFTPKTDLATLCKVLDSDREIGGACGVVRNMKPRSKPMVWNANVRRLNKRLLYEQSPDWRVTHGGIVYQVCDLVANAGVWRKEVFADCPWDEELEIHEHREWFWRLKSLERYRCAFVPVVSINHYGDRPNAEYSKMRRRQNFYRLAERKVGARLGYFAGGDVTNNGRPNIVVLGVGHSNTTVTTQQLHALGWQAGDADKEYAESVRVRNVNQRWEAGGHFDRKRATTALLSLKQPWAIKDPRFARGAITPWMPLLSKYRPLLLWIVKDIESVVASYERRKERVTRDDILTQLDYCADVYEGWPWGKLRLDAESVEEAVSLWR